MDEDAVGLGALDHLHHAVEDRRGDVGKVLVGGHDIEVEIGADGEQIEHLIEHLAVLGGDADAGNDALGFRQALDDHGHLDGLGPRPENGQNAHGALKAVSRPAAIRQATIFSCGGALISRRR